MVTGIQEKVVEEKEAIEVAGNAMLDLVIVTIIEAGLLLLLLKLKQVHKQIAKEISQLYIKQ